MKKIRKMDASGDTVVEFDETQADANATREAEALFGRLKSAGAAIFAIKGDRSIERRVENFNDLGPDNIAIPKIVGG